jgi:hypothetical protein
MRRYLNDHLAIGRGNIDKAFAIACECRVHVAIEAFGVGK